MSRLDQDARVFPYQDITAELVDAICCCLAELIAGCATVDAVKNYSNSKIHEHFKFVVERNKSGTHHQIDAHLTAVLDSDRGSLNTKSGDGYEGVSRISSIIKQGLIETMRSDSPRCHLISFPSPFRLAYELLTVPSEPASRSYSFFAIREYLLESTQVYLENSVLGIANRRLSTASILRYGDVDERLKTIETHSKRGHDAFDYTISSANNFVYLLLSVRGLIVPRFNYVARRNPHSNNPPDKLISDADYLAARLACAKCLKQGAMLFFGDTNVEEVTYRRRVEKSRKAKVLCKLEFVASQLFAELPSLAEVSNEIWGVPVPLRGADVLFSGGLKLASDQGLVIGVAGTPGSGKTSFALALATAWAPFGTNTYYFTLEEDEEDLSIRQSTLKPSKLAKTSVSEIESKRSWFYPSKIPYDYEALNDEGEIEVFGYETRLDALLATLRDIAPYTENSELMEGGVNEYLENSIQVPNLIVLDGLQNFLNEESYGGEFSLADPDFDFEYFIEECRALNAVVLILSTSKNLELDPLERLVDVSINIDHRDTNDLVKKAYRAFILKKTRHQISRPGASICHLSSEKGFRISPQLASQVDKKSLLAQRLAVTNAALPEKPRFSFFNKFKSLNTVDTETPFVETFPNSHILLHGKGSSGKASLGLMCLSSPLSFNNADGTECIDETFNPKILVVSFLYPEEYYANINRQTAASLRRAYATHDFKLGNRFSPQIKVIHCHPGFLQPEDLYAKINAELDSAELSGERYTGVLIDGTHNVFLQFPLLEKTGTMWPMLYTSLRTREGLKVVTTHTTISVGSALQVEQMYQIRQDKPFLIALLQASDFYFELNELPPDIEYDALSPIRIRQSGFAPRVYEEQQYVLECITAIAQPVPRTRMLWDKRKCTLRNVGIENRGGKSDPRQSRLPLRDI